MNSLLTRKSIYLLLFVGFLMLSTCSRGEAQLFKKAAQRRAARQSGGNYNNGTQQGGLFGGGKNRQSSSQDSNQYEQPKTGLFGRTKPVKEPKEKTGLFGRPKEEKNGLFGRAKERREQEAYANQQFRNQYSPQRYTQHQMNQYASSNSVHRSQGVTSTQPLFNPQTEPTARPANSTQSGRNSAALNVRPVASTAVPPGETGTAEQLPKITRPQTLPANLEKTGSAQPRSSAIVRSRPKLPQRTQQTTESAPTFPALQNTSQELPVAKPTGSLPKPMDDIEVVDATLA